MSTCDDLNEVDPVDVEGPSGCGIVLVTADVRVVLARRTPCGATPHLPPVGTFLAPGEAGLPMELEVLGVYLVCYHTRRVDGGVTLDSIILVLIPQEEVGKYSTAAALLSGRCA